LDDVPSSREVNINFQTRTIGVFEIVEPVLEQDEVFDSNLLKQTIDSMISEGKRNISVDLAGLEYLYSDTINALVVMNKRMLDVFGRLSLLAPQPPVMDILKKSGIQNILKVFADEAEIVRLSQELAAPVGRIPSAAAHQAPISEFDALRAEIGSAFGDGFVSPPAAGPAPSVPSPARARHAPAPGPGATPHFTPPPPQRSRPRVPMAPMPSPHETVTPKPSFSQKVPPPPPKPAPKPQQDLDDFEATLDRKVAAKTSPSGRFARPASAVVDKKSPAIPVAIVLLVLIVVGGGGYFIIPNVIQKYFLSNKESAVSRTPTSPETSEKAKSNEAVNKEPALSPIPTAPETPEKAKNSEATNKEPALSPTPTAPETPEKAKSSEAVTRKKAETVQKAETRAPVKEMPTPTAIEQKSATPANEVATTAFIASQPPNADVYIDGKLIGKSYSELQVTPGTHSIRLVKDDKEVTQQITFHPGKNPTTFITIK
jgi:anti-anti-sigma factor